MRTLDKRVVGTLLAATVGLTSATIVSGPAEAAPPARIKGVVSAAEGGTLVGIRVAALAEMTIGGVDQWVEVDTRRHRAWTGSYSVGKLAERHVPGAATTTRPARYSTEFYNDKTRAVEPRTPSSSSGGADASTWHPPCSAVRRT